MTDVVRKLVALVLMLLFAGVFFALGLPMIALVVIGKTCAKITESFVNASNKTIVLLGKLGGWKTEHIGSPLHE